MSRFRSAVGKEIDMAALVSKHEHVRAAGNMGVNARGDVIDGKNQVILDNNKRINSVYGKTVIENSQTMANKILQASANLPSNTEYKKSELTPDEPIHNTVSPVIEEPDIISPEEMELLHDNEVAEEDDFSVDDIVKVVNQKP